MASVQKYLSLEGVHLPQGIINLPSEGGDEKTTLELMRNILRDDALKKRGENVFMSSYRHYLSYCKKTISYEEFCKECIYCDDWQVYDYIVHILDETIMTPILQKFNSGVFIKDIFYSIMTTKTCYRGFIRYQIYTDWMNRKWKNEDHILHWIDEAGYKKFSDLVSI